MKQTKKIVYNVQCAFDEKHFFEKAFFIEEGTESTPSEVEAFCPFCDKQVTVTVQGKSFPTRSCCGNSISRNAFAECVKLTQPGFGTLAGLSADICRVCGMNPARVRNPGWVKC